MAIILLHLWDNGQEWRVDAWVLPELGIVHCTIIQYNNVYFQHRTQLTLEQLCLPIIRRYDWNGGKHDFQHKNTTHIGTEQEADNNCVNK